MGILCIGFVCAMMYHTMIEMAYITDVYVYSYVRDTPSCHIFDCFGFRNSEDSCDGRHEVCLNVYKN